jgi:hypothetical protein
MSGDELVEQVTQALWKAPTWRLEGDPGAPGLWAEHRRMARAAIEAVYDYQAEHGGWSDAELDDGWAWLLPRAGEA